MGYLMTVNTVYQWLNLINKGQWKNATYQGFRGFPCHVRSQGVKSWVNELTCSGGVLGVSSVNTRHSEPSEESSPRFRTPKQVASTRMAQVTDENMGS